MARQSNSMRAALAFAMLLTGCTHTKQSTLPDLMIPKACVNQVTLKACDLKFNPPHCKTSVVAYQHGCEQLVVKP